MTQRTLSELKAMSQSRAVPYGESITVQVVKRGHVANFTDANGQQAEMLNFSIADQTGAMLATLTDKTKHGRIIEGKTLHVRDFILKAGKVALSHRSTIMMKPKMEIESSILETAMQLIMPASPVKKLTETKTAPIRSIFTIQGQIVKNEATKTVKVAGNDTKIRTITIEEDASQIDVTLWRELAEKEFQVGDFLRISHTLLNEWQGRRALNSTRNTSVEKIQPLNVRVTGKVEALSITDMYAEVAVKEEDNNNYKEIKVDLALLKEAVSRSEDIELLSDNELEDFLLEQIPFMVEMSLQGSQVLTISVKFPSAPELLMDFMAGI
uniref:Uncharacterized protein LOC111128957 n=1 Tax=Crassostrea virginica TaxID=6565 RepID=A0A8B8DS10_CRAVI|nr:uncharacterized protein LOC111128957 [Crassostrea virginica]